MLNSNFNNVKTEVAIEMISLYIGMELKNDKEQSHKLIKERERFYLGDNSLVDKAVNEYGEKIKKLLNQRLL